MIDTSNLFPDLPPESRVWSYVADRKLSDADCEMLEKSLIQFSSGWSSHGRPVESSFAILERRVLVIAARVLEGDISGCGIDKSLHLLETVSGSRGFDWVDALQVAWREDGELHCGTRSSFRQRIAGGRVDGATPVLDTTQTELGAMRADGLERPAADSWHSRVFELAQPVSG